MGYCRTMKFRLVATVWVLLSMLVTVLSVFSFVQPSWIVHGKDRTTLGIFSFCLRPNAIMPNVRLECGIYGGYFEFAHLPSVSWQVTCILCACGCGLLALTTIMAAAALLVKPGFHRKLTLGTGYIQIMAGNTWRYRSPLLLVSLALD